MIIQLKQITETSISFDVINDFPLVVFANLYWKRLRLEIKKNNWKKQALI